MSVQISPLAAASAPISFKEHHDTPLKRSSLTHPRFHHLKHKWIYAIAEQLTYFVHSLNPFAIPHPLRYVYPNGQYICLTCDVLNLQVVPLHNGQQFTGMSAQCNLT